MNPIRVMIAEDEIAIANLIKNLIDFERLNLEFIGFALNGQIAYEMILSEKPDIVITDISMPVMNGLELIEKSRMKNCRYILSSSAVLPTLIMHFPPSKWALRIIY